MRGHGVRVGVLAAGAADTPSGTLPGGPDRARMLTPDEVAEAVLLMAALGPEAALEEPTLCPPGGSSDPRPRPAPRLSRARRRQGAVWRH